MPIVVKADNESVFLADWLNDTVAAYVQYLASEAIIEENNFDEIYDDETGNGGVLTKIDEELLKYNHDQNGALVTFNN
jgi:hypothetical protein